MEGSRARVDALLCSGAGRLKGHERRLFMAEVTLELCGGSARRAERRFGWGRGTVDKGLHELRQNVRCLENFRARGRKPFEQKHPQFAEDVRAVVEPHTQADPELKSERRYSNLSAREVLEALETKKGYASEDLPSERTMRDVLKRMNYRLKRIQKAKPLKKPPATDAIFANIQAIKEQAGNEPTTLEISLDVKAKVHEGDYARGGKNPQRCPRADGQGMGP